MAKFIDLTGQKFGRLTVVERAETIGGHARWLTRCDCGNDVVVISQSIRTGHTRSCGCLMQEARQDFGGREAKAFRNGGKRPGAAGLRRNVKHGLYKSSSYGSWHSMRKRCRDKNSRDWPHYGGRGIAVCDRWQDFANFHADMGERPSPLHSIDRIDNDGDYEPGNCRWATPEEQAANRSR